MCCFYSASGASDDGSRQGGLGGFLAISSKKSLKEPYGPSDDMYARGNLEPGGILDTRRYHMKDNQKKDQGFTLVEILIAIVVVGILAAVVVVGISSLTSKGNATACTASKDAATAGSTTYYAITGSYPATLTALTTAIGSGATATPAPLTLPSNVTVASGGMATTGATWTLTMTTAGTSTTPPVFACT
jgi:prepilin-type N-terminal cleavage/methylation domain-containing protein